MSGIIKKREIPGHSLLTEADIQGANLFIDNFEIPVVDPHLSLLTRIVNAFQNIPYENLSKILVLRESIGKNPRYRTPFDVVEGYLRHGLGGTCFSLTRTLWAILKVIGFNAYPVMGDMYAGKNEHCALIVLLKSGNYLVDPGYILSYPFPLNREPVKQFRTHFNIVEIQYGGNSRYRLYTLDSAGKKWRYSFSEYPTDWESFYRFWKESFHRRTMHGLCLSRITEKGMVYLHKNFFMRTSMKGKEKGYLQDISRAISELFNIPESIAMEAREALQDTLRWDLQHGYYIPGKKRK